MFWLISYCDYLRGLFFNQCFEFLDFDNGGVGLWHGWDRDGIQSRAVQQVISCFFLCFTTRSAKHRHWRYLGSWELSFMKQLQCFLVAFYFCFIFIYLGSLELRFMKQLHFFLVAFYACFTFIIIIVFYGLFNFRLCELWRVDNQYWSSRILLFTEVFFFSLMFLDGIFFIDNQAILTTVCT